MSFSRKFCGNLKLKLNDFVKPNECDLRQQLLVNIDFITYTKNVYFVSFARRKVFTFVHTTTILVLMNPNISIAIHSLKISFATFVLDFLEILNFNNIKQLKLLFIEHCALSLFRFLCENTPLHSTHVYVCVTSDEKWRKYVRTKEVSHSQNVRNINWIQIIIMCVTQQGRCHPQKLCCFDCYTFDELTFGISTIIII